MPPALSLAPKNKFLAINLLTLLALAASPSAFAQLWDTAKGQGFNRNYEDDWAMNWGPYGTVGGVYAAAYAWCIQTPEYVTPGVDCEPHPGHPDVIYFYGTGQSIHDYWNVVINFRRNNGAYHGKVQARWYVNQTDNSDCPTGTVIDPILGYDCVDPNTLYALQTPKADVEPEACVGNPCDPITGNKSQTEVDFVSSAEGVPALVRHYNSKGPHRTGPGMAPGWRHTYSRELNEEPDLNPTIFFAAAADQSEFYHSASEACTDGWDDIKSDVWDGDLSTATATFKGGNTCEISSGGQTKAYFPVRSGGKWGSYAPPSTVKTITRPSGSTVEFEQDGSDWVAAFDESYSLEQSGSDWVFTDANDTKETYNASGQLTSITSRNGQTQTLEYNLTAAQGGDDNSSTLDKVTGEFGHTLTFGYDSNDRLISVTTPDGTVTYGFDSDNNLSSATYPDTSVRQYVYEDTDLPHHLTGIIDENSDRFATWSYDDAGRAVSSEHAGGKEDIDLTYNSNGTTTIDSANGASRTYTFGSGAGRRELTGVSGDVCSTCAGGDIKARSYDSNGNLYEATDWNNVVTRTARNNRGLVETLTEAQGTADQRVTTTVWHADYRLPTKITTPKNVTDIVYDADGNPTSVTVSSGSLSRAWTMTYNNDGQVLTVDGPRTDVTDVTTMTYHTCTTGGKCGQLASITNALSHVTTYDTYDASGRLTKMTEPNGRETSFTYDARGNVLAVTETPAVGSAVTTTMTYDDVGQLATLTTPEGTVLTYSYTAAHYLESVTDNYGNEVAYTYDSMGNVTDEDTYDPADVLTRSMEYAYGLDERLDSVIDGSIVTTLATDLVGNLTTETDGRQNASQHVYDALNRLDQTTDSLSGVTSISYDDHDNVTSVAAPNNATTSYTYDDLDNLTSESSPDRGLTSYTHDAAGNVLTETDARSIQATYTYDALNRVTSVSYPNTAENVTYGYDVAASNGIGRLTSISDQSGTTTYTYDEFGRVATDARVISGVTYTTSYAYDDDGNIESMTYPSGRVVDYTRNSTGEITQVSSTKSGTTKSIVSSAHYASFGPISNLTYGNSVAFTYSYNTDYSVDSIESINIADDAYSYDAAGNIVDIEDTVTSLDSRTYVYDDLNRVEQEGQYDAAATYKSTVQGESPLLYWRLNETSGTTSPDISGNVYDGTYNGTISQGQPSLVSDSDTSVGFSFGSGHIEGPIMTGETITGLDLWINSDAISLNRFFLSLHNGGGQVRTHVYHRNNGHIYVWHDHVSVIISNTAVSSSQPHHLALWYDSGANTSYLMIDGVVQNDTHTGNIFAITDPEVWLGGQRYNGVSYSSLYSGDVDELAVYDLTVTASMFLAHYNWGSTGTPPFVPSDIYTYDGNGNRTSKDNGGLVTSFGYQTASNQLTSIGGTSVQRDLAGNRTADPGGTRTYSYSDANRLNAVLDNSITTASYVHNALGQRAKKTVGSAVTVYIYDLAGNLVAEHDGTGALIRDYAWMNGVPVAQIDSGEVFSYLHFDHLGTPRIATNDSQTVVWRWDSDAFGSVLPDEDPDGDSNTLTVNLRFPGQYYDDETGFHYNYFRTYDPATGRYVESDPIGLIGGLNTFSYVGVNPMSAIDPFGLDTLVISNGQTVTHGGRNPLGHTAAATTGSGVYSQGNNARPGSSVVDYVRRELGRRDTRLTIIETTPEQEATILDHLMLTSAHDLTNLFPDFLFDNCASRTSDALASAGLWPTRMVGGKDPFEAPVGRSSRLPSGVEAQAKFWRDQLGGQTIVVPKNSDISQVIPLLQQFEPE